MDVYQTSHDGVFLYVTTADQDPMDPTNWLIPGGCVTVQPPSLEENQLARWDGTGWLVEGVPVEEEPPTPPVDNRTEEDFVRFERDMRLGWCDWTMMPDTDDTHREAWIAYRQALRDVTSQTGFPDNVVWPKQPYKTPLSVERHLTWEE